MCARHTLDKAKNIPETNASCRQRECYIRIMTARVSVKTKSLVVSLKGFLSKKNWLAVNRQSDSLHIYILYNVRNCEVWWVIADTLYLLFPLFFASQSNLEAISERTRILFNFSILPHISVLRNLRRSNLIYVCGSSRLEWALGLPSDSAVYQQRGK
jgi:hypothetical protein